MSIQRSQLEAVVYGPIDTAGIVITSDGRMWGGDLPPKMLRQLVNGDGEPCNGVYFHCIKDRADVHSRIEEGNIRLDVLLNNTCFHRKLMEYFPNGLDGMETIQQYSGMRMAEPTFVKIVERASEKLIQGCMLKEGKDIETYGPGPLDEIILDLAKSEICHGSRIIKIGKADQSIQGRIDGYRVGFQASVTKYCYGFANNVFQRLELFFIDIKELNNLLGKHSQLIEQIEPRTLERDLLRTFRSVHGALPPWEQQHRYAAARNGIPDSAYKETLLDLLDVIEKSEVKGNTKS